MTNFREILFFSTVTLNDLYKFFVDLDLDLDLEYRTL